MPHILVEEPVQEQTKTPVLLTAVSWYFIGIGVIGLASIVYALVVGIGPQMLREPATLAAVLAGRLGLILAGLQLRKRQRMGAIAALVAFALPLLGNLTTMIAPLPLSAMSAAVGIGFIAAVWKDLRKD